MHPAEKELINGALDAIEASCRSLRRYLSYASTRVEPTPTAQQAAEQPFPLDGDPGEDSQMEVMLARMMGLAGGANES